MLILTSRWISCNEKVDKPSLRYDVIAELLRVYATKIKKDINIRLLVLEAKAFWILNDCAKQKGVWHLVWLVL